MTEAQLKDRASKGQVRDGPGKCEIWTYGILAPPPYVPFDEKGNQEIDIQVAKLIDYASNILNIPASHWRNDSESGGAARVADNFYDTGGHGEMRRNVLLRIVRALYGKTQCSFSTPLELFREDDVYYFPDGAAFCKSDKPTAFMAASMLAGNSQSRMMEATGSKGLKYVNRGLTLTDAAGAATTPPPAAAARALAPVAATSPTTTTTAAAKKKPAATKTIPGTAAKKK